MCIIYRHQKRDLTGWAQPFMGFHRKSDGQKKEKPKNEDWNRKNANKIYLTLCKLGWRGLTCTNWQLPVCGRDCILAHKLDYIHVYIKLSQFVYYTRQVKQDDSGERWKETLFTQLLRPQSFVLAGWWSLHRTQQHGIWMDKAWCLVQGWNSFCILHCNTGAAAYILLLESRSPDQFHIKVCRWIKLLKNTPVLS